MMHLRAGGLLTFLACTLLPTCGSRDERATPTTPTRAAVQNDVNQLLDRWHRAASEADGATYFGLLADDAVFLGTDPGERWGKAEFQRLYGGHFDRAKAWSFRALQRHVNVSGDAAIAWFDEELSTEKMGPCRGSGVLRRVGDDWQIVQYNLSVPIPNDMLKGFVAKMAKRGARKN